ncbi:solute carrier family 35 member G1-like [Saccoglossus kowalevskii]|uniref:Solute carrier family 35 member G1-like n=1 Tax=Saccoglossus kowalevskii TaxID=10224 RepID=A0ABM0MF32_SACKO|nr:PREDICTED: solute carrier family 35 member G1-like [Saccoglossus kowalevskii]
MESNGSAMNGNLAKSQEIELSESDWLFSSRQTQKSDGDSLDEKSDKYKACMGTTMGLLAGVGLGISDTFCVVCLYYGLSPAQVLLVKSLIMLIVVIPLLFVHKVNILKVSRRDVTLNVMKGLFENGGDIFFYYALAWAGLGDGTAIAAGAFPIFTPLIACVCVRERCKLTDCITIVINVIGIILISRPEFIFGSDPDTVGERSDKAALGYVMAICASFCLASGAVCVRGMSKGLELVVVMFFNGVCGLVITIPLIYFTSDAPIFKFISIYTVLLALLAGMVVFYFVYVYSFNKALKLQKAGRVALLCNIQVVVGFAGELLIFNNPPTTLELVGAGLVLLSSFIVTVISWCDSDSGKVEPEPFTVIEKEHDSGVDSIQLDETQASINLDKNREK